MVTKMLTLNTAHLSSKTLDLLTYEAAWEDAGAHKEKEFPTLKVYCVGHPNITGTTYIIDADRKKIKDILYGEKIIPNDLYAILCEAFVEWCDTIRLRDDGPKHIDLPVYDCDDE